MPDPADSLDAAARRLDSALARLEGRVTGRLVAGGAPLTGADRGEAERLTVQLAAAHARGRELEAVAADASAALGRAAAEVRAALAAEA